MISQAQKIDCRALVGEKYFRFFRNRIFQQNQISRLTPHSTHFKTEIEFGINSLDFPCKNSLQCYYIYVMSTSAVGVAMLSG